MLISPGDTTMRLGDTLTIHISIPFNNINTRNNNPINISGSSMSEFGIDYRIINIGSDNKPLLEGVNQFAIFYKKGTGRNFSGSRIQNSFAVEGDGFVFTAKVVPLKKGLVNIVNYRAEGKMQGDCVLNDFVPFCANPNNNHHLIQRLWNSMGLVYDYVPDNHFYIWVN
jgi:hypothetical protein